MSLNWRETSVDEKFDYIVRALFFVYGVFSMVYGFFYDDGDTILRGILVLAVYKLDKIEKAIWRKK